MKLFNFFLVIAFAATLSAQEAEVVKVVSQKMERNVRLPGEFNAYQRVAIFARVPSFVEAMHVDRGSVVKEGQLLVSLTAPEMIAQVAESESKAQAVLLQLAEAQAKLLGVQTTYEMLKAASATPGAISVNELTLSEKAMEGSKAVVEAVGNSAKAARSAVDALKKMFAYLEVKAPFDGVVTERLAHPGALVGPGTGGASSPLLYLEQSSRLRLVVPVPEAHTAGIATGMSVSFTVPAHPGQTFRGTVARLSQSLDTRTRSMAVELDVPNPTGKLSPGMYADVDWPVRMSNSSLLVPASSVVVTTERMFVIRVRDGKAEWVNVTRGAPLGDLVEVVGPLRPGDQILKRANDEIREGATIKTKS
ncbi:MAG: efflux RND transporter periplasmic adaptor subunit [Acidobacteria bacterium]|nr:efflux RND transporter periplasmic adaptor subunit [Acidobacteriota bacterium]